MHLNPQQRQVYDYIKRNSPCTIRDIRNNTFPGVMKPDMRISEINYAYKKEHGDDLIINVGKNKHREMLKGLKVPLYKKVSRITIVGDRAVETFETVEI